MAYRLVFGLVVARQIWLLDWQILLAPVLISALILCALFAPGVWSAPAGFVFGCLAWLAAVTMFPKHLWWQSPLLRQELPDWLLIAGGAVLLACLVLRQVLARRWYRQLRGHGYEWIIHWAEAKPFEARALARRVLRTLGYSA